MNLIGGYKTINPLSRTTKYRLQRRHFKALHANLSAMPAKINKVVIPAAGLGTRFLPATKAQPKEMLPLVDKPAIQYVVEEAVGAGLTDILIITGRGKRSIEDHFDRSFELEYYLEKSGKAEDLAEVRSIAQLGEIHYLRQGEPLGLGHAVLAAKRHVNSKPFAVMLADDIMDEGSKTLNEMLSVFSKYGRSVVALMEVAQSEISSYGAVGVNPISENLYSIRSVVEKPAPEEAPSCFAIMGRYIFTPEIFDSLEKLTPGKNGEIQLTDAIGSLLERQEVIGYVLNTRRYDVGNKADYLRATIEIALKREDLGDAMRKILKQIYHEETFFDPQVSSLDAAGALNERYTEKGIKQKNPQ
ncbi:UDP-glucose pyrophosphorylase [Ferrithrix thermotolerans DSM 19514]|uniref:UTP--glucose-1-phosphate uridylyltransferase n=2 Tax=Ferrithrix TaxID=643949 RepID=A0A1M4X314_9ACTN|nr:UDP-glucose pyrophosphorylase [Ferrithrix thermotolerans DSM 19514]